MFDWLRNGVFLAIGESILAILLAFLGLGMAGCQEGGTSNLEMVKILQQGKFQGDITVTSDGRLGGGVTTTFSGGAGEAALAAHGTVNFADQVRHVTPDD